MENKDKLDQNLDDLHAIDSNLAEYMLLFTDALRDFEIESLFDDPSRVTFVYPDLEDDQSELLNMIQKIKSSVDDTEFEELKRIIENIFHTTERTPVTRWALTPIMEHLDLPTDEQKTERKIRFYMQNLLWDRTELEKFYRACKFKQILDQGSGSHTVWRGKDGRTYGTSSDSKKMWAKNNIKELIEKGFPIEKIEAACKKLKIDFRIISK